MKTRLKDIVNIRTGYQFRGKVEPTTEASGIPFIQIKDVDPDFGLDPSDVFCVNVDIKTSRDKVIEKYGVQTGDVLFLSRGAQLFATAVEPEIQATIATSYFFILRVRGETIAPGYLAWFMNHQRFQSRLAPFHQGSHIKTVSRTDLQDLEIKVPSLETQRKIAELQNLRRREMKLFHQIQFKRQQLLNTLGIQAANNKL